MNSCFYCEHPLKDAQRTEWDHFPVPKCAGGTETVPSCHHCHREKTHMGVSRLVKRLRDSVRFRKIVECAGDDSEPVDAFLRVMFLNSSVCSFLNDEGLKAAEKELRGEYSWCDGLQETDYLTRMQAQWPKWTRDMRLCVGAALEEMYSCLAFERRAAA